MQHLLNIEWMKIKSYRTFWVLVVLFIAAVFGINYIGFYINTNINNVTSAVGLGTGNPYSFYNVWLTTSWMSSWVLYLPGFIIIFLVSNEFQFKTHRQNIIDGLSRQQFIVTKLSVTVLLAFFSTLIVALAALIFGWMEGSKFEFGQMYFLAYFFVCACIYIFFALILALLLRKAALAVGLYFIYGIIVDNVASGILRNNLDNKPYGSYFLPLDVADSLLPFPFFKSQLKMALSSPNEWICLGICIAWMAFYLWFPIKKFEGEDL